MTCSCSATNWRLLSLNGHLPLYMMYIAASSLTRIRPRDIWVVQVAYHLLLVQQIRGDIVPWGNLLGHSGIWEVLSIHLVDHLDMGTGHCLKWRKGCRLSIGWKEVAEIKGWCEYGKFRKIERETYKMVVGVTRSPFQCTQYSLRQPVNVLRYS